MKTIAIRRIVIAAMILTFALAATANREPRWQDVIRVTAPLPFTQAFIDSVTAAHIGSDNDRRGLRTVPAGRFANGETLVYEVGWGPFQAGWLILSAERVRGRGLIKLSARVMTSNAISAFYKMSDHVISWVDDRGFYPLFFESHAREGKKYKMDSYIVYDVNGNRLFVKKREVEVVETPKFTHDYLSILYYARSQHLRPGHTFAADMFAAPNKTQPMSFKVHDRRETVRTPAGSFECLRVEPTMVGEGRVFTRRDKMEVWVTDDAHKYPVMVKSQARVGSIHAKLVHIAR